MNDIKYFWRMLATLSLFWCFVSTYAQNDGFARHTVKGGETLYSIASSYGTSVNDIKKHNPGIESNIRTGQIVLIAPPAGFVYHTIQKGETLYQLTKTYHVSAQTICKQNPGFDEKSFKVGEVIRLPQNTTCKTVRETVKTRNHEVKKKETLYSIGKMYNVSEQEIKAVNPELNGEEGKLKKGMTIKIPVAAQQTKSVQPRQQTLAPEKGVDPIRIAVVLPLKNDTRDDAKSLEFYKGFLLAVDSLRQQGVSATIHTFHSGRTEADIQTLLQNAALKKVHIIVGPLYQEQIPILSDYSKRNEILLLVPFLSKYREINENPYLIQMNASDHYQIEKACKGYTALFKNNHTVFCGSNEEAFPKALAAHLKANNMPYKTLNSAINEESLLKALSANKTNTIVPTDHKITSLNILVPQLKTFVQKHPEYRIRLFGYPEWQTYVTTQLKNFYLFDTCFFTNFYRNPLSPQTTQFDRKYQKWFGAATLTYPCMAMSGFDFGYYALRGLSLYGKKFTEKQVKTIPYQNPIDLKRVSNWGGLVNNSIWFVHYKTNNTIEVLDIR